MPYSHPASHFHHHPRPASAQEKRARDALRPLRAKLAEHALQRAVFSEACVGEQRALARQQQRAVDAERDKMRRVEELQARLPPEGTRR